MKLWVLGSGSQGNAVLLEAAGSRVLIDAGFPASVLAARLAAIAVAGESIEAVVLTHEHTDHARGAVAGARRWKWRVFATGGTALAFPGLRAEGVQCFAAGDTLEFDSLSVQAVRMSHDAAEPVALVATARASGARAAVAYDLGHPSSAIRRALERVDLLVLEANHDEGMLRAGPYPPWVRERIAGPRGHLSNRAAAALIRDVAHRGLSDVVLAHLSEACNDPRLAWAAVREGLRSTRLGPRLQVAPQHGVLGPVMPSGAGRAVQLSLAL